MRVPRLLMIQKKNTSFATRTLYGGFSYSSLEFNLKLRKHGLRMSQSKTPLYRLAEVADGDGHIVQVVSNGIRDVNAVTTLAVLTILHTACRECG